MILEDPARLLPFQRERVSRIWERRFSVACTRWRASIGVWALGLIAYGGVYTTAAHLSLAGWFSEAQDLNGLRGHAYLWSPLFLAWGLSLAIALLLDRKRRAIHGEQ
ncbi:DUF3995 domain-containing protein [Ancrocorticia populi]|uniref:Uncharacterized protein n=1 Tax=Ancrocorticia populi TaxID=2175228 RepID=A0A2V1K2M0_9ACTO|nr:DUF3995 domain-containing protein [Ancrocorticia populi]PWF24468.1 hypothetical protein DD236_10525 [Ancrocorticia populi]